MSRTTRLSQPRDQTVQPQRIRFAVTPEELRVLDDFRFKRRMPSRAAAVRELLRRGFAAVGSEVTDD